MKLRLPSIETHDGRRALAFLAIVGGGMVFTVYAFVITYFLRDNAGFLFWLAMAGHIHIFTVLGALGWFGGRRMLASATRDGVTLDDRANPPPPPSVQAQSPMSNDPELE